MIDIQNVKYCSDGEDVLSFSIGEKGIHGIFCDDDCEIALLTDILSGARDVNFGKVLVGNESEQRPVTEQREKIGVSLSKMPFYDDMTVEETLEFVVLSKKIDTDKGIRQIKEALSLLGIENIAKKQIKKLSLQNRRRLSVAQALLGNPDIIIFESPTSEIDENCEKEMRELIKMLGGMKCVVLLSSDDELLVDLCDDVSVISGGKLLFCGSSEALASHLDGGKRLTVTLKGSEECIEAAAQSVKALSGIEFFELDRNVMTVNFDSSLLDRETILIACENADCTVRSVKISARAVSETFGETVTVNENNAEEEE